MTLRVYTNVYRYIYDQKVYKTELRHKISMLFVIIYISYKACDQNFDGKDHYTQTSHNNHDHNKLGSKKLGDQQRSLSEYPYFCKRA